MHGFSGPFVPRDWTIKSNLIFHDRLLKFLDMESNDFLDKSRQQSQALVSCCLEQFSYSRVEGSIEYSFAKPQ